MSASTPIPATIDLSKYIDTEFYGARPHVRGRRLPVTRVGIRWEKSHLSVEALAYEYTLSEEEVLAALLYYREHKAALNAQDEHEQIAFDASLQSDPDQSL